jgi:diguanylate cyclase (GGDEF)-like protein
MAPKLSVRQVALLVGLAIVYTAAGKLGLRLGLVNPSASPVWAPTGIALAAFIVAGDKVWPAIFAGALVYNLTTAGSFATSLAVATGNTLEGLIGGFLVHRWANGTRAFERGADVVRFAALGGLAATAISPTIGVTSLALGDFVTWNDYVPVWLTWWLGDAAGALIVAPPLIMWSSRPHIDWTWERLGETAALFFVLVVLGSLAFGPLGGPSLGFLCIPVLIWAALRFGRRVAATAVAVLAAIAVAQVVDSLESLGGVQANAQLLLLQTFMAVTAVTILVLAAVSSERQRGERRLRELAISDPLTGLANYRQLVAVLAAEIKRSQRTTRGFALILFDLDGLKQINDGQGHLAGNSALLHLAECIRITCREIDTPARFGGDEFAVILPEADEAEALGVAERVRARLASDLSEQAITTSVGVALYPKDGDTMEQLLLTADRALYGMKQARA